MQSDAPVQAVGKENSTPRQKQPSLKILNINYNSLVSDNNHVNLASLLEAHKPDSPNWIQPSETQLTYPRTLAMKLLVARTTSLVLVEC